MLRALVTVAVLLGLQSPALAQQPALRRFDVGDGLGHNSINHIFQDSRGYLWISSQEGLSRFDGREFRTFGLDHGLASAFIDSVTEDPRGRLWAVVHNSGLHRLDEAGGDTPFRAEPVPGLRQVFAAGFDGDTVWVIGEDGIYRGAVAADGRVSGVVRTIASGPWDGQQFAWRDRTGRLWFGMDRELITITRGAVERYTSADGIGADGIVGITQAPDGAIYAANEVGLFAFTEPPGGGRGSWRMLPFPLPADVRFRQVLADRDGQLWVGTSAGLQVVRGPGHPPSPVRGAGGFAAAMEDRDGNIWAADLRGLLRISSRLSTYTQADGLPASDVRRVLRGEAGRMFAITTKGAAEITPAGVRPLPGAGLPPFNGSDAIRSVQIDRDGDWWVGTLDGSAHRVPGGDFSRAQRLFRAPTSGRFPAPTISADARQVWIGAPGDVLYRVDLDRPRDARVLHRVDLPIPLPLRPVSRVLATDARTIWLSSHGGLARVRDNRVEVFAGGTAGLPETEVRSFFLDSRGWLWLGLRYRGLSVSRAPNAAQVEFENYSTRTGLASNTVWSVTEDAGGSLYLSTGRSLDRLDPRSGEVVHYTPADGLAGVPASEALVDPSGDIWSATRGGLTRVRGDPPNGQRVPAVYLTGAAVGGIRWPMSIRGAGRLGPLTLSPARNNLVIDYAAPWFTSATLQYQRRLSSSREWDAPVLQRSVNYAYLAPGTYHFEVRAVTPHGLVGPAATVEFTVLAPVWQRGWFVLLSLAFVMALTAGAYRYRVRHLLAMENIRRQVALDLHDDVGSGLAQIAILSEIGREEDPDTAAGIWSRVAELARSLRGSMNDIVWAIDPRHDHLSTLIQRMEQVAFTILGTAGLDVEFIAPDETLTRSVVVGPDRRRHLLLVFKEALTNVTRHAAAKRATIHIAMAGRRLTLEVRDDGRGFDPSNASSGQGLQNFQRRAAELGGSATVLTAPDAGTVVRLDVPI